MKEGRKVKELRNEGTKERREDEGRKVKEGR